jgi:aminoglycoside phosphotransferase
MVRACAGPGGAASDPVDENRSRGVGSVPLGAAPSQRTRSLPLVRHGYTNQTDQVGTTVTKAYAGPHAMERARAERIALTSLAGRLPIPVVLGGDARTLVVEFVPGRHGQDLVEDGFAEQVLASCGEVLRSLHSIDPALVFGPAGGNGVIVHGDFGPNNLLLSPDGSQVAALLDWEFCHLGEPIEDLAWCEWIIRAHHPHAVGALRHLFAAYGRTPPWSERHAVMLERCALLEQFCRDGDPEGAGVALWIERRRQAEAWHE